MNDSEVDVLIASGGPFGLMLANELGRRGVKAALFDAKPSTAFNPQANATQARTMEHYRRLGFADEIRRLGLPADYPTDIAYFTRYAGHELARFKLPSAKDAHRTTATNAGSWNAAEPPHRVSQKYVERVLRSHAEALAGIEVNFDWRLTWFQDEGERVRTRVERNDRSGKREIVARYLVGGDGPRSTVRRQLGIAYGGETGVRRHFFGGRMFAIYIRCSQFYEVVPHAPAWMNCTFNEDRRAFMAAVDGRGEFAFHTQLREGEDEDAISDDDARRMFQAAIGVPVDCEILSKTGWTAGHALVADRFADGRVFIGGDAAHLFTPAGGLGYNTAIEDAVNLGWKLAAALKGVAGHGLLASYEIERRAVAVRNTNFARAFADSLGNYVPAPEIEDETPAGEAARREAGAYLEAHGRKEFNIPGITFGARYDGSPAIVPDGATPPEDLVNEYRPSAVPGGRPPHYWLAPGRSLYDAFGFEWTLLRLGGNPPGGEAFLREARRIGIDLTVVGIADEEVAALYEMPLVLIRPDQIVAWRGADDEDAEAIFSRLLGRDLAVVERV
ncbi:FAD-dependent oxidoreductase [Aquibium sp. LZ166]|uniref:FAD-dependent oxidoreductase n=1 Tax=Aquibium pacificus TaxID=3153579 RepID=A0ABV3SQA6_9HYPH